MTWINRIKLCAVLAILGAGIYLFYSMLHFSSVLRGGMFLLSLLLALALAATTDQGRRFRVYAVDAGREARRVSWPTRREAVQMTGVVLLFVFLLALFLSATDWIFSTVLYGFLLTRGQP